MIAFSAAVIELLRFSCDDSHAIDKITRKNRLMAHSLEVEEWEHSLLTTNSAAGI
jgi:hypothetical protein